MPKQINREEPPRNPKSKPPSPPPVEPTIEQRVMALEADRDCRKNEKEPSDLATALKIGERWLIGINGLALLVSIGIGIVYIFQLREMKKSTDAATKAANTAASQLELAERPWLSIVDAKTMSDLTFGDNGDGKVTVQFLVKNSGNTPARDVWVTPEIYVQYGNGRWPIELKQMCERLAAAPPQDGQTLFPNIDRVFSFTVQISKSDMARQNMGKFNGFIAFPLVCVEYRAAFSDVGYYYGISYWPWSAITNGVTVPAAKVPLLRVPGFTEIMK